MNKAKVFCEKCGEPARFHMTSEQGAENRIRHFCLSCATYMASADMEHNGRLSKTGLVVFTGLIVGVLLVLSYRL